VDIMDGSAVLTGEFRAVFAQGHGQTKMFQRRRMQHASQTLQIPAQAGCALLKSLRLPQRSRAGRQMRRLQPHGRQPLAQVAAQFRGHPAAFIVLLAEQAGRQRLQLLAAAQHGILLRAQIFFGHFLMRDVARIQNNSALRIGDEFPADAFQHAPGAVSIAETEFAGMLALRVSQAGAQELADGVSVVRMHEFEDRAAHQCIGPDPENTL